MREKFDWLKEWKGIEMRCTMRGSDSQYQTRLESEWKINLVGVKFQEGKYICNN